MVVYDNLGLVRVGSQDTHANIYVETVAISDNLTSVNQAELEKELFKLMKKYSM